MEHPVSQTTTYVGDLHDNNLVQAITDYGKAESHLLMTSKLLATGLITKFPSPLAH